MKLQKKVDPGFNFGGPSGLVLRFQRNLELKRSFGGWSMGPQPHPLDPPMTTNNTETTHSTDLDITHKPLLSEM